MKLIKIASAIALSVISIQSFAAPTIIEANSTIVCEQNSDVSTAIDALNAFVSSPDYMYYTQGGAVGIHLHNFTSSAPVITAVNGKYVVCVTLTRK